jgi:hypothetical protein
MPQAIEKAFALDNQEVFNQGELKALRWETAKGR